MGVLRARKIESVPSLQGVQADIALIEPNGDEYRVRCLCKLDGSTDIGGDPDVIAFLNAKYGLHLNNIRSNSPSEERSTSLKSEPTFVRMSLAPLL